MNRSSPLRGGLVLLTALLLVFAPPPVAAQDDAGAPAAGAPAGGDPAVPPPPPPVDLRFFPKELSDAIKELTNEAGDEESQYEALREIARMVPLTGSHQPLLDDAWPPVLRYALATRHDTFAATAGEFFARLDAARLEREVSALAKDENDPRRLYNMTFMVESLPPERAAAVLEEHFTVTRDPAVVARTVEAFGRIGLRVGLDYALGVMGHKEPEIRNLAAVALGRIGSPDAIPALVKGIGDSKGMHGMYCAAALGRIASPDLFEQIVNMSASGSAALAKAKAIEGCARRDHLDQLLNLIQKGRAAETRAAAANAIRRIAGDDAPNGGGTSSINAGFTPDEKDRIAQTLLGAVSSDRDPVVRANCFWALRRVATERVAEEVLKKLIGVKGDDKLLYLTTLLGELRYERAAPTMLQAIFGGRQEMLRRAAGATFWQIGHQESIDEFERRMLTATDSEVITRGSCALGSWKSERAFDLALKLLRKTNGRDQFEVMKALEKMTGHYFGPYPGTWAKWFEQNPKFFTPKQTSIEREKWREEFDKENKGFRHTKETEKSVQMGLSWLARHQEWDGSWDSTACLDQCTLDPECSRKGGGRTQFARSGMTGIAVLPFTGAGYGPDRGKYRHTIDRALESLYATLNSFGDYDQDDLLWNRSYARPIALQALAEGFIMSGDPRFRYAADLIVMREFSLMNERGGWRYSLTRGVPELDSSVTAWVLFAIKSADKAGLRVPSLLYEGAYLAFDQLSDRVPADGPFEDLVDVDPDYGFDVGEGTDYMFQTGYDNPKGGPGRATTPLGLMSRILMGWRRSHPFCIGSANYIQHHYLSEFEVFGDPGEENWSRAGRFAPQAIWTMYNYYYCTLAMHQMGGSYFYQWNRRISRVLPYFQKKTGCERGTWEGWGRDSGFGWIYTTSMGVMTLETYYRYLPILQD